MAVFLLLASYGFLNVDRNIYLHKEKKIIGVYSSQADHFQNF